MTASLSVFAAPASGAPSCLTDSTSLCAKVYEVTHSSWLAANADTLIATPARILLVVVVAIVARMLVNRGIRRLTESTASGAVPTVLRPLRAHGERAGGPPPRRAPPRAAPHRRRSAGGGAADRPAQPAGGGHRLGP